MVRPEAPTEVALPPRIMPGPLLAWAMRRPSASARWAAGLTLVVVGPLTLLGGALALGAVGVVVDQLVGGSGPLAGHPVVGILAVWIILVAGLAAAIRAQRNRPAAVARRRTESRRRDEPVVAVAALGPDEPGRRSAIRPLAVEAAVYLGLALLLLWPIWLHPTTRFVGVHLDPPYYVWLGWRFGQAFRAGQILPTHFTGAVHPFGIDTALLDGLLPSWITGVFNLVTGPFLAYNLTLLVGTLANLVSARKLARVLSPHRLVWIATSAAFATAPAVAGRLAVHLPFVFAFTLPLLLAEALVVARGDRAYRPVRVAVLLVVAYLCSAYFLIFGLVLLVVPVLVARSAPGVTTEHPPEASRGAGADGPLPWSTLARTLGIGLALTVVVLSPFIAARLTYNADERRAGAVEVRNDDAVTFSADALGPITPPDQLTVPEPFPSVDRGSPLSKWAPAFGGALLLAGLSGGLLLRFRLRTALLVTGGVTWLLCLGPSPRLDGHILVRDANGAPIDWMPYRLLLAFPGLSGLRSPDRVAIASCAVLTAMVAVGLTWVHRRGSARRGRFVVAGALVVGVALNLMLPMPTLDLGISPTIHDALVEVRERGSGPGDAVLMVPADCDRVDPDTIVLQIVHERPSLGCSTSASSIRWESGLDPWADSAALASLRCDQSIISRRSTGFSGDERLDEAGIASLRDDLGVRFVIVDEGTARLCPDVAAGLPALGAHETIASDGRYTVIDLSRPAASS